MLNEAGFAFTFASQTEVEAQYQSQAPTIVNALETGLENYLNQIKYI